MLKLLKHLPRPLILLITLCATMPNAAISATLPEDASKAVILAYHRIGEDAYPDTNIRLSQFIEHIHELERGDYTIMPVPDILSAIKNKRPLPDKTVGITFEGAYMSAWYNAIPILMDKDIPFTVFYASNKANQNQAGHMGWQHLKKLAVYKHVTLATLPKTYSHIARETKTSILASINKARADFRKHFAHEATLFAYPFGEYTQDLQTITETQGYTAAFALHSGPIYSTTDLYAIPRFSMTEDYADLERLRLVTNTLPLPITDITPEHPNRAPNTPLAIGFTLPDALANRAEKLFCFLSGYGKVQTEILGTRIEIRPENPESITDKTRLNCTIPESTQDNETPQWRWLSMLFYTNEINKAPNPEPDALPKPLE